MAKIRKIFALKIISPTLSFLIFIFVFYSCSSTKYLKENQYLLKDNKIHLDTNSVDRVEVKSYAKQKPNRRLLGWAFYVSLYKWF